MSDLYISPERIYLIYSKTENVNRIGFDYTIYKLVSVTTDEARADEEIKKNPSGLMKKVIGFKKEFITLKIKSELMGVSI